MIVATVVRLGNETLVTVDHRKCFFLGVENEWMDDVLKQTGVMVLDDLPQRRLQNEADYLSCSKVRYPAELFQVLCKSGSTSKVVVMMATRIAGAKGKARNNLTLLENVITFNTCVVP